MAEASINYWAVLVSGATLTVLGAVWYMPGLFGNLWLSGIGRSAEEIRQEFTFWKIVGAFVGALFISYGIARVTYWSGGMTIAHAITVSLLAAVCFTAAPFVVNDIMEGRRTSLTIVNVMYNVVGFVIAGVIIGAWR